MVKWMRVLDKTLSYYKDNNIKYGIGAPQNLWKDPMLQSQRFNKILQIIDLNNSSLLDVGSGYGDLYIYAKKQNIKIKTYIGIDLVKEHCDVALKNLPTKCSIIHGDFLLTDIEDQVDYCILSGGLNIFCEDWLSFAHGMIDKMWNIASVGIVFNLRSPESINITGININQLNKIKNNLASSYWCNYAESKTKRFALYHDYVDYDYTIALWKEDRCRSNNERI